MFGCFSLVVYMCSHGVAVGYSLRIAVRGMEDVTVPWSSGLADDHLVIASRPLIFKSGACSGGSCEHLRRPRDS